VTRNRKALATTLIDDSAMAAARSSSDVPVIILTGRYRDEVDCVVGLELGADDYLTKPFGIRELYARFRRDAALKERKVLAHPRRRAGRIQVRRMAA
jgi:DNA-binding response OmpR family regulator